MRSSAQNRLTAVGRLPARYVATSSRRLKNAASSVSSSTLCKPMQTPYAAAMPIAGAPRTRSEWIASHTPSRFPPENPNVLNCVGRSVWSIISSVPSASPFQLRVSICMVPFACR